eukprot:TRINITY_DN50793_c0_g1_i1.p1 TRINITY_DN50793_c0_g1~~TRINITY_DN50793_c0_g1_i1.p1  ORF type:complete len:225 (+),score=28.98 TRINITY_DN50793_c0_g1_i1:55-675(+)
MARFVLCAIFAVLGQNTAVQWSGPEDSARHMRTCIRLAQEAQAHGGSPYGAIIVDPATGSIIEGRNNASQNPLWHGEMAAINNFSDSIAPTSVYAVASRYELYTSAEPCPMCMSAIAWSGFGRVVYGTSIPFIEQHGGEQIDLRASEVVAASPKTILLETLLSNETDPLYVNVAAALHHAHVNDRAHDEVEDEFLRKFSGLKQRHI